MPRIQGKYGKYKSWIKELCNSTSQSFNTINVWFDLMKELYYVNMTDDDQSSPLCSCY